MKNRKRNRMKGYDYSQNNLYFITSCVKNMVCCFGEIVGIRTGRDLSVQDLSAINENSAKMILNEFGLIAKNQLVWLENQYSYVILHKYVIMPNHIHVVIEIDSSKIYKSEIASELSLQQMKIKSLSQIMGAYKTTCSKLIHNAGYEDFAWHRSFYDHIIRDENGFYNIINYIENNPENWLSDIFKD
ncbi:MAG: transposase [Lutibacter sp.]